MMKMNERCPDKNPTHTWLNKNKDTQLAGTSSCSSDFKQSFVMMVVRMILHQKSNRKRWGYQTRVTIQNTKAKGVDETVGEFFMYPVYCWTKASFLLGEKHLLTACCHKNTQKTLDILKKRFLNKATGIHHDVICV